MTKSEYDLDVPIHWCPGCGNFGTLNVVKDSLDTLGLKPHEVVIVSGIGQAGKFTHFIKSNKLNGLHGRYLSNALGIKASNPKLTVIAISGDGCTYSEGGNHFIHTIRYNPDIVNIVSNNQVYGLTKGQASPTSGLGFKTKVQNRGVYNEPFNAVAVAISLNASFVSRAFIGDAEQTKKIVIEAIKHKGYALIDLFSPCVSFNRVNTYAWYKENTYYIEDSHDPTDQNAAMLLALKKGKFPLGIFYVNQYRTTFEKNIGIYQTDDTPLYKRNLDKKKFATLLESFR
jgi:2-oxoglutarate ferredoxin oxidoreductase subunit beta